MNGLLKPRTRKRTSQRETVAQPMTVARRGRPPATHQTHRDRRDPVAATAAGYVSWRRHLIEHEDLLPKDVYTAGPTTDGHPASAVNKARKHSRVPIRPFD